jgi:hypothetical protein
MNQYFGLLYKINIDKEFKFFKHKNDVKQQFSAFLPPIGCVPRVQVKRRPSATGLLLAPTQLALRLRLAYYDF